MTTQINFHIGFISQIMGRQGLACSSLVRRLLEDYESRPFIIKLKENRLKTLSVDEVLLKFYSHIDEHFRNKINSLLKYVRSDFIDAYSDSSIEIEPNDELLRRWLFPTLSPVHAKIGHRDVCIPSLLHKADVYVLPVGKHVLGGFQYYKDNKNSLRVRGFGEDEILYGIEYFRVELSDTFYDLRSIASQFIDIDENSDHWSKLLAAKNPSRDKHGNVIELNIHIDSSDLTSFRSLRRKINIPGGESPGVAKGLGGYPLLRDAFIKFGISKNELSRHVPSVLQKDLSESTLETLFQSELLYFDDQVTIDHPLDPDGEDLIRVAKEVGWAVMDLDVSQFIERGKSVLSKFGFYEVVRSRHGNEEYQSRLAQYHHAWDWNHALSLASDIASGSRKLDKQREIFEVHRRLLLLVEQTLISELRELNTRGIFTINADKTTNSSNMISRLFNNTVLSDENASVGFWEIWLSSTAKYQEYLPLEKLIKAYLRLMAKRAPKLSVVDRFFHQNKSRILEENNFALGYSQTDENDRKASMLVLSKILLELRNYFAHGEEILSETNAIIQNIEFWHNKKRLPTPERPDKYAKDTPLNWVHRIAKKNGKNPDDLYPEGTDILASRLSLTPKSAFMLERLYVILMLGAKTTIRKEYQN